MRLLVLGPGARRSEIKIVFFFLEESQAALSLPLLNLLENDTVLQQNKLVAELALRCRAVMMAGHERGRLQQGG